MKIANVAGITWGLIYFVLGAIKSFTLNSHDTWASVILLLALFILPLPITVLAVWLPRFGGNALLGCITTNLVAMAAVIANRQTYPSSDMVTFVIFIVLYNIPHLCFGVAYLRSGKISKTVGSSDERSSVGLV